MITDLVLALERIAFLLERAAQPSRRVEAFRAAAGVLRRVGPEEVRRRGEQGSLQQLAGIGTSTGTVAADVLAGRVPEYLARWEATAGTPVATGGEELLAALRGDCHTHSDSSDGGAPVEVMARTARDLDLEWMVITDHSPRLTVANGLSAERLRAQLDLVGDLNAELAPFRILTGIEVDILDDGSLDQTDELLGRLDVVVASVHSKLRMPAADMTRRMLAAVRNPHTDVLGHCTGRLVSGGRGTRPESQFDAAAVFAACAEHGVAVEVSSRPERLDPPRRLLRQALDAGCLVSVDTDAHAPGQLDWQAYGCARAVEVGVRAERVVTTWRAEQVLAWAGDRTLPG